MALFDVIMPVKNGAAYLEQAMRSIECQTVKDWRLLVLDHGSTDASVELVQRATARDCRIELHSFPQAAGLAGLLNEGLSLVQARYAMRMDADDESLPTRMQLMVDAFVANPDMAVIGGQADVMDAEGRPIGEMILPCTRDELARTALFRNPLAHPTVCLSVSAVVEQGMRYGISIHQRTDPLATIRVPALAEDYLLFGELACARLAMNVPQKLLRYRVHAGSVGEQKRQGQIRVSADISRHLAALLARQAGMPAFDPVPFGTWGESLVNVEGRTEYREEHAAMCRALRQSGSAWAAGDLALEWRRVYVDRLPLGIALRAAQQWRNAQADAHERRTARNVVMQLLRGRKLMTVPAVTQCDMPGPSANLYATAPMQKLK